MKQVILTIILATAATAAAVAQDEIIVNPAENDVEEIYAISLNPETKPRTDSEIPDSASRRIDYIKSYDSPIGFSTGVIETGTRITGGEYPQMIQIHEGAGTQKEPFNADDCTCNGIPLKGSVKVVTSGVPDFEVKIVEGFADLDVQKVGPYPAISCGQWEFVEHCPDFTIQYVEHCPDFTIRFVKSYPGARR
jgi:hypothetical protein